ncbi:hypothetical protein [Streptomyces flavofungini]|uniref:Uncharacterized protein n=1 Tax=Streptomyces flavofungini TaxID=68200 RepID=A0ABS0XIU5_9ACTN|nr:hypothetical protein [Streptomyces flavofungini]MBJ3813110.1 hypothetical protein [Streptomyces flavofungini]GHC89566.1 hypothetical protein GCM10010349_77520 [Streptomyces flavofungini]
MPARWAAELADVIDSLRSTAAIVRETGNQLGFLARVVEGDVRLAKAFRDDGPWGAAAPSPVGVHHPHDRSPGPTRRQIEVLPATFAAAA